MLKEYVLFPFILGLVLFTVLHYFDSEIKSFEESVIFGIKFAALFAIGLGTVTIFGNRLIRPILDSRFTKHRNLNNLKKYGFEYVPDRKVFKSEYKGFETEIFYAYEESEILKSRFVIVMKFGRISESKLKTLKIGKQFANSAIFEDFLIGHHRFVIKPPSTKDLLMDIDNFFNYLTKNEIKP